MAEAIDHSLQRLDESDLRAIAVFLKSVPAVHDAADTKPVYAWGAATDNLVLTILDGIQWALQRRGSPHAGI